MLKAIMFIYAVLTTLFRVGDFAYILTMDEVTLPIIVVITISILIIFGIYIIIKRILKNLKLRELALFSILSLAIISFNIAYIALNVPIKMSSAENMFVGSLLDIIINVVLLYYYGKRLRSQYITVSTETENEESDKNN